MVLSNWLSGREANALNKNSILVLVTQVLIEQERDLAQYNTRDGGQCDNADDRYSPSG